MFEIPDEIHNVIVSVIVASIVWTLRLTKAGLLNVTSLCYNYQVVSCDVKSTICVWNLLTGAKVIQYLDCHQKMIKGSLRNQEITSMIFDPSFRRLVTGRYSGEEIAIG